MRNPARRLPWGHSTLGAVLRRLGTVAALWLGTGLGTSNADIVFDARGLNPNRDYFSQLPYEHIDTMTGGLLLTYTDLVLPGNAGFDLRIQRTYNSKIYRNYQGMGDTLDEDSWAGAGWSLHLGRVIDPFSAGRPTVEMPDGTRRRVYRHIGDNTARAFITRDYWVYYNTNGAGASLAAPVLYLPNGLVYTFGYRTTITGLGTVVYVTDIKDPFGNRVKVTYAQESGAPPDAIARIEQTLGGGQTRTVTFTYEQAQGRRSLRTMAFLGRTWTYTHAPIAPVGYSLLTSVQPPVGPAWRYDYNTTSSPRYELTKVAAPGGGEMRYVYADRTFYLGSTIPVRSRAVVRRATEGRGIAPGAWTYEYAQGSGHNQSVVSGPCGTTTHRFLGIGTYVSAIPVWQIGLLAAKSVSDASGVLESEQIDWRASDPISRDAEVVGVNSDSDIRVPLVARRTTSRGGRAYVTSNTYGAARFNNFGQPNQIAETGELSRTTVRTFTAFDPNLVYLSDKVATSSVSVGEESFAESYSYDASTGFKTAQTVHGIATTFAQDGRGNLRSLTDANNHRTRYDYAWGLTSEVQTPAYTITRQINPEGTLASETRRGFTTSFNYDNLFRVVQKTQPEGDPVVTTYDNANATFQRVSRGSSVVTTSLDGFARPTGTANSVGIRSAVTYDACGRKDYESYPFTADNIGTRYGFDALGRVTSKVNPDATAVSYAYQGIDVAATDESGRVVAQDFSAFGEPADARLVALTDAERHVTRYDYNALGSLVSVDTPAGPSRTWEYNGRGELVRETHPENGTVTYTYDPAGNLETRSDAAFGTSRFTYDRNDRLVAVDRPGTNHDSAVDYDESDNRVRLRNGYVTSTFSYDGANRLRARIDAVSGQTFTTTYTPDASDNIQSIDYPSGGRVVYNYDAENRIDSVIDGHGSSFAGQFTYHPSGALASFRSGNGIVQAFTYDNRYRVKNITAGNELQLTYAYDAVGNVRSISDARAAMSQSFGYDDLDRLTSASGPWGPGSFSYDDLGNRKSKSTPGLTQYTYASATNRLASASGAEPDNPQYDPNGNIQQDRAGRYGFTPDNMLETADVGNVVTSYRYDGDNLRKMKLQGGDVRYFIHGLGNQILSEWLRSGGRPLEIVRDYVYAGTRLIAAVRPSVLTVDPGALVFAAITGGSAPPVQSVLISNSTAGAVAWQASSTVPWLALGAASGTTPTTLGVSANAAGLAEGSYSGMVVVTSPGVNGSPRQIPVTLVVSNTAALVTLPANLRFTMPAGAANPPAQPLSIVYGGAPVSWTMVADAAWLNPSALYGSTPANVTVTADGSDLAEGTYTATMTVIAAGVEGSPRSVPVELVVQPGPGTTCADDAWYCEPFDGMDLGDLDGQGGWHALPGDLAGAVEPDSRGAGKVLALDPPPGPNMIKAQVALAERPIEGTEIAMHVMTVDADPDTKNIAKIEFFTEEGAAWGKTRRTFGDLRLARSLSLLYGRNVTQTLVENLESGRWYSVKLRYVNGQVRAFVDGVLVFTTPMGFAPGLPFQALTTTAWRFPGAAYIDLIQVRPISVTPEPDLLVEPLALHLTAASAGAANGSLASGRTPASGSRAVQASWTTAKPASLGPTPKAPARAVIAERYGKVPLAFEPNMGQADSRVKFLSRGRGYALLLRANELGLWRAGSQLTMRFRGANPKTVVRGMGELPGKSHYLIGKNPKNWRTNIPQFERVRYEGIYPGVDLVFYGNQGQLEYDLVVAPHGDPRRIRLTFDGAAGVRVEPGGDLVVETGSGTMRQRRPLVYQEAEGEKRRIDGRYILKGGNEVGFALAAYDTNRPLTIDPVLTYSTVLGDGAADAAGGIGVDAFGNAYVLGGGPRPGVPGSWDANVTKFDPTGTSVLYSTYFGGGGLEFSRDIAVDSVGNAYVTGTTLSTDFPVVGPYQATSGGGSDAFVAKLNPSGQMVYSTYLGGSGNDGLNGIAVDSGGSAYLTGGTTSANFPLENPLPTAPFATSFVSKLNAAGTRLVYSTFLGGYRDEAWGIAVDAAGSAYVTGQAISTDFPLVNALQPYRSGWSDAFVAKLDPAGNRLVYSTYLGGSAEEIATDIALDGAGNAYLTGFTHSADFPLANPIQPSSTDSPSPFVAKLNAAGTGLLYSTFLGAGVATAIAVDANRAAHVVGSTFSEEFPLVNPLQAAPRNEDAFVTKINPAGTAWVYSTRLGGNGSDGAVGVAVDAAGNAYVVGQTESADFPTAASPESSLTPGWHAFVSKLVDSGPGNPAGRFQLSAAAQSMLESGRPAGEGGDDGTLDAFIITVERIEGAEGTVTIDYTTNDGSATAGTDYEPISGTLTFAPGERVKSVLVEVLNDEIKEDDEGLTFTISNPTGDALLGSPTTAELTIVNDDANILSASFTVRDRNLPAGPDWEAGVDVPWLWLSAYNGTGPSTVTVDADITDLTAGTHMGTITITAPGATSSPQTIQVTLTILGGDEARLWDSAESSLPIRRAALDIAPGLAEEARR